MVTQTALDPITPPGKGKFVRPWRSREAALSRVKEA